MNNIKVQKEARSSRDCFRIATTSLELAKRSNEDWEIEHHSVTGTIFTAFSIEAMLNHFGKIFFNDWDNQRIRRKELHKKLFNVVNLPDYLGSKAYEKANECFKTREKLAHGKTVEEDIDVTLPEGTSHADAVLHITTLPTEAIRNISIKLLDDYILTARKIEKDIQENGYYPNQEHLPIETREKLLESPLDASGISIWKST